VVFRPAAVRDLARLDRVVQARIDWCATPRRCEAPHRQAKAIFERLGVLCNDDKQDARRPFRLPMALFPVLNRIHLSEKPNFAPNCG
jgi:hypothetical protein